MDHRQSFMNNPGINPYTGRTITIGGPTYNKLVKEFGLPQNNNLKLSGVSSWYCFDYRGRRYNFFSDIHNQPDTRARNCESEGEICTRLDNNLNLEYLSDRCWEFPAYLDSWLRYNGLNNIMTDLHVEVAYGKDPNPGISNGTEYMNKLINKLVLQGCLHKNKNLCLYGPNVRIHYSNGRSRIKNERNDVFAFLPYIKRLEFDKYNLQSVTDCYIVMEFIVNNYQLIFQTLYTQDNFTHNINRLITNALLLKTSIGSWYRNYLVNQLQLLKQVTSIRDNKQMHKIAVQLRALSLQGDGDIGDLIIQYFTNKLIYVLNTIIPWITHWYQEILNGNNLTFQFSRVSIWLSTFMNDVYFLGRMFRFTDSRQVIGLSHEAHTNIWVEFFINYLGVQPTALVPSTIDWTFDTSDLWTRCITSNMFTTYTFPGI